MSSTRQVASPSQRRGEGTRLLLIFIAFTLVCVGMMLRLRPADTMQSMLDPNDKAVQAMDRLARQYPVADEILVMATLQPDSRSQNSPQAGHDGLLDFARHFERLAGEDVEARTLLAGVEYAPPKGFRELAEKTIVPNGLLYLDDSAYSELMSRLTLSGMSEMLRQDHELIAAPGPAAVGVGRVLIKDPLRIYEFFSTRAASLAPAMGGFSLNSDGYFSPDGQSLLLRIQVNGRPTDLRTCASVSECLDRLIAQAGTEGIEVRSTGAFLVAAFDARAIRRDSIIGVLSTVLALAAVFAVLQRSPVKWFVMTFTPVAMGIVWGFAAYSVMNPVLTPLAAVVGGALGGVGIDYCVFVYANSERLPLGESMVAFRRSLFSPLSAAFATSVIGFAAIAYSPVHILRDFAILGSLALLGAFAASVTVLPAAIGLFRSWGDIRLRNNPGWVDRAMRTYRRFLFEHAAGVLFAGLAAFVVMAASIAFVARPPAPDSDLMVLHPQPNVPLENQKQIAQTMGVAAGSIQLLLEARTPSQLVTLSHEVENRLNTANLKAAGYIGTLGVCTFLPDPSVAKMRRDQVRASGLPSHVNADFETALKATGFSPKPFHPYEAFLGRFLSPGQTPGIETLVRYPDAARLVLPRQASQADSLPTEALQLVFFSSPPERREYRDAALTSLQTALAGLDGVSITGTAAIGRSIEAVIYRDLGVVVGGAFAAIALYHLLHFRSLKVAIIAMSPTFFSLITLVFFMGVAHQALNLVNMVMIPLLLGIDIDYGILTVSTWTRANSRRAVLRQFPVTAHAVITCAACTTVGFGSLVLTSVPAVRSLGWLINVGVVSCLIGTLVLLWPILFLLTPPKAPRGQCPSNEIIAS